VHSRRERPRGLECAAATWRCVQRKGPDSFRLRQWEVGKRSVASERTVGRTVPSSGSLSDFRKGTILEFRGITARIDLESCPVPVSGGAPQRQAQYGDYCKPMILKGLVALTGVEPVFAAFLRFQ
jgi:hypothetical protein